MSQTPPVLLLVEDDIDTRTVMKMMLEWGLTCRVLEAGGAAEALGLVRTEKPTLVLLDLALPDGNGLAVARAIQEDPNLADVAVVVISNHCWEQEWVRMARAVGCRECIDKARLIESVPQIIAKYLKPAQATEAGSEAS